MKKALMIVSVLFMAVFSTACINNIAVQELNNKAAEFMQKGDYESAINRLQASIDLDSSIYQTHYNLGVAAINAKKYDVAIKALEDGVKLKPDFADFYYSLGVAQYNMADEIENPSENDTEENVVEKNKQKLSEEDKFKIIDLKKSAYENLNKYIKLNQTSENKDSVEAMIKSLEEGLNNNSEGDKKEESLQ